MWVKTQLHVSDLIVIIIIYNSLAARVEAPQPKNRREKRKQF